MNNKLKILSAVMASQMLLSMTTGCGKPKIDNSIITQDTIQVQSELSRTDLLSNLHGINKALIKTEPDMEMEYLPVAIMTDYQTTGFRVNFEKLFNINKVSLPSGENSKQGCMFNVSKPTGETDADGNPVYADYHSQNTSFRDAYRNKYFLQYIEDRNVLAGVYEQAKKVYSDIADKDPRSFNACYNAYFGLMSLGPGDKNYNANQLLTREQFYSLVYKAGHGYTEGLEETDEYKSYISKITSGSEHYNKFVAPIEKYGYLSTSDGTLNNSNIQLPITKFEALYLISNLYFRNLVDTVDLSGAPFGFQLATEATADTASSPTINREDFLIFLLNSPNASNPYLPEEEYRVARTGYRAGLFNSNTDLLTPISKDETITLLVNTFKFENTMYGNLTTVEYGDMEVPEEIVEEYEVPTSIYTNTLEENIYIPSEYDAYIYYNEIPDEYLESGDPEATAETFWDLDDETKASYGYARLLDDNGEYVLHTESLEPVYIYTNPFELNGSSYSALDEGFLMIYDLDEDGKPLTVQCYFTVNTEPAKRQYIQ